MSFKTILACLIFILLSLPFKAQDALIDTEESIHITKAIDKIRLDGVLDESSWASAELATDFWMKFPVNDRKANGKTEAKITYDDKFLYIAVVAYQEEKGYLLQSLKRDKGLREGDGVGFVLDPINEKANGFYFSLSPYNTQAEGLIGSNDEDLSFSWDNKWYSQTKVYEDKWVGEIAIPFNILRYEAGKKKWGLNFIRSYRTKNEFHTWSNVPLQFRGFDLGYLGTMNWDEAPPQSGMNISLNPYVSTNVSHDAEAGIKTKPGINAGFDGKVAVSSSLNLDFTVNPDFSNVDVDQQVTNLTRFDVFFPERRVFFLENDDLFSNYGIPPIRPFYSRRIGSKNGTNVPIIFGARLSGNLAKNTRVGIMNVQTGRKNDMPGDNFTALSVNQRVLDRSLIKGYFLNRSLGKTQDSDNIIPIDNFGRNAGVEGLYSNKSGTVNSWGASHFAWKPGITDKNSYSNFGGGYFGQNFTSFLDYTTCGKNYYTDMGFVNRIENYNAQSDEIIRRGFEFFYNETNYSFNFKDNKYFNRIDIQTENFFALDDKRNFNERSHSINVGFDFKTTAFIDLNFQNNDIYLIYPFRYVSDESKPPLPYGRYKFNIIGLEFSTDARKNFIVRGEVNTGKFYSADYNQVVLGFTARKQPYLSFALNAEYNDLKFPAEYGSQKFLLLAPQVEWNFSNNLFWTSFLQYNSQNNNFNINSRLQWRFKPMSDMFLVYSDNYYTDPFGNNKNRALVLKFNYWINV